MALKYKKEANASLVSNCFLEGTVRVYIFVSSEVSACFSGIRWLGWELMTIGDP